MTTYLTIDGERFVADREDELVNQMRDATLAPTNSDAEFMRQYAGRIKFNSGQDVRSDTAENFVADLIATGCLKITLEEVEEVEEDKDETAEEK